MLAHCFSPQSQQVSVPSPHFHILVLLASCSLQFAHASSLQVLPLSFAACCIPSFRLAYSFSSNVFFFILGQIPVHYSHTSIPNIMLSYTVSYSCKTLLKQVVDHTTFLKVIPRYPTCRQSRASSPLLCKGNMAKNG